MEISDSLSVLEGCFKQGEENTFLDQLLILRWMLSAIGVEAL